MKRISKIMKKATEMEKLDKNFEDIKVTRTTAYVLIQDILLKKGLI